MSSAEEDVQVASLVAEELGLSTDLRDYVSYFPERPPRADRDRIEGKALHDPAFASRVAIWDFFFLPVPEEIRRLFSQPAKSLGLATPTPYDLYINKEEELREGFRAARQSAEANYGAMERQELIALQSAERNKEVLLRRWKDVSLAVFLLGLLVDIFLRSVWITGAMIVAGLIYLVLRSKLAQWEREYASKQRALELNFRKLLEEEMSRLSIKESQALTRLKEGFRGLENHLVSQASCIPTGQQVLQWLQQDLDNLKQQILSRTALEPYLVNVRVNLNPELSDRAGMHLGNPMILCLPAEIQTDRIPERLKQPIQWKHVKAKKFVQQGRYLQLINGVYYLEALLIGTDMLGTYGCFFDFIEGVQITEKFSEQYYSDVISMGWAAEALQLSLSSEQSGEKVISLDRVPTFTLSLSSGEKMEFSIATQDYARQVFSMLSESGARGEELSADDSFLTVDQASVYLDTILRALRAQLRRHKRSVEEQAQEM